MTDVTQITITATAEIALKKLKKAEIGVYDCKKDGAKFIFSVKDKHIKKVFAIFAKPCYNITVTGRSMRSRLIIKAVNRVGLFIGAMLFILLAVISNTFVFKIEVSGSGSYLASEVKSIIYNSGVKEFKPYAGFDAPAATGKILALPQVTFCNIEKHGSILKVDVQVDEEHNDAVTHSPLIADRDGVIRNIAAICGTPLVSAGDSVKKGDTIIAAYTTAGEKQIDCLAVGYAEIECYSKVEYFSETESDESLKQAYSSVLLYADEILTRNHTVKPGDGGVIYVIEFTYLHKLNINME